MKILPSSFSFSPGSPKLPKLKNLRLSFSAESSIKYLTFPNGIEKNKPLNIIHKRLAKTSVVQSCRTLKSNSDPQGWHSAPMLFLRSQFLLTKARSMLIHSFTFLISNAWFSVHTPYLNDVDKLGVGGSCFNWRRCQNVVLRGLSSNLTMFAPCLFQVFRFDSFYCWSYSASFATWSRGLWNNAKGRQLIDCDFQMNWAISLYGF